MRLPEALQRAVLALLLLSGLLTPATGVAADQSGTARSAVATAPAKSKTRKAPPAASPTPAPAAPDAPAGSLPQIAADLAPFRTAFDEAADRLRVVLLLSPS